MMDYIRATSDAREGFLTLLHPKVKGEGKLAIAIVNEKKFTITTKETVLSIEVDEVRLRILQ